VSSVTLRNVKHRLAEVMAKPGGISIETALAQADAELAAKAAPALAEIAAKVTALEKLADAPTFGPEAVEEAYGLASEIVNVAGCLKTPLLFAAAYGLCDITDYFRTAAISRQAFEVHVRALRLILLQGETPAMQGVVDGLKAVRDRVLAGKVED
jgi:hypothetical protein